jgi:hypothetical protein
MHDNLVLPGQADVKNLGLGMVDPNDRVEVARHVLSSQGAMSRRCALAHFQRSGLSLIKAIAVPHRPIDSGQSGKSMRSWNCA